MAVFEDENVFQRLGRQIGLDSFAMQDVAQEVRIAWWQRTGIVPSFLNATPYTRRGLIWDAIDEARTYRRFPLLLKLREDECFESFAAEHLPAHASAEAETLRNEQLALGLRLLGEGLLSLSVDLRDAWILREIVQLDYSEIVKSIGLKAGKTASNTARQRHSRAEKQLSAFFRQHQCTIFPCKVARFLLDLQEENAENAVD